MGTTRRPGTGGLSVAAVGVLLFGVLLAYGAYRDVRAATRASDWPSVQGVVIESRRGPASARFAYAYEVGGTRYTSRRVGFVTRPLYRATRHHVVGDSLVVRYDPSDPATAVIRWGVGIAGFLGELVAPLVFLLVAGYLLRLRLRE